MKIEIILSHLQTYCESAEYRKEYNDILLTFKGQDMMLTVDSFTHAAEISTVVITKEAFCKSNYCSDEICELANAMNQNFKPYRFTWEWGNDEMIGSKIISFSSEEGLMELLKWEIRKLFHLPTQAEKALFLGETSDFPEDESFMQFMLGVIDKWVAEEYLDINILYLHGFASSGNSGTAKEIQECLPNCKVISPDLPIHPSEALELINKIVDEQKIDLVIGTSMGGYFAAQISDRMKILVNPSFHVSRMMKNRLGDNYEMTIPYFKAREDGATDFVLTKEIANLYFALERNIEKCAVWSNRSRIETLGVFGTDDDVVDCRDEYLSMYENIRFFKGGHRLNKEAVEEVIIPSILQMVINERTL